MIDTDDMDLPLMRRVHKLLDDELTGDVELNYLTLVAINGREFVATFDAVLDAQEWYESENLKMLKYAARARTPNIAIELAAAMVINTHPYFYERKGRA